MNKSALRKSERIYGFLLKLYPKAYRQEFGKEMQFVFSESLKDAYKENGDQGIVTLWGRTMLDTIKSLVTQYKEYQKGGDRMKTKRIEMIADNKIFLWLAVATLAILVIPYVLTLRDGNVENVGWNWSGEDYIFGFIMIFGFSSLFVLAARKVKKKHRLAFGIAITLVFLYVWAELAVGIFTNLGS